MFFRTVRFSKSMGLHLQGQHAGSQQEYCDFSLALLYCLSRCGQAHGKCVHVHYAGCPALQEHLKQKRKEKLPWASLSVSTALLTVITHILQDGEGLTVGPDSDGLLNISHGSSEGSASRNALLHTLHANGHTALSLRSMTWWLYLRVTGWWVVLTLLIHEPSWKLA